MSIIQKPTTTSSSRSAIPEAIVALFLALMTFQVGFKVAPQLWQDDESTWLSSTVGQLLEQKEVLDDEGLEELLLPEATQVAILEEAIIEEAIIEDSTEDEGEEEVEKNTLALMMEEYTQAPAIKEGAGAQLGSKEAFAGMLNGLQHLRAEAHLGMLSSTMSEGNGMTAWATDLEALQMQMEARMSARSTWSSTTAWAQGLVEMQDGFEARMLARKARKQRKQGTASTRAQNLMAEWDAKLAKTQPRNDGSTAWGKSLVKLQEQFEARTQARGTKQIATTPFTESLVKSQKYFEELNAANMAKRRARSSYGMTSWGKGLVKMQKQMEARMQARSGKALAVVATANPASASTKAHSLMTDWDAKFAKRHARREGVTAWAQDLSAIQAGFEERMQARSARHVTTTEVATPTWAESLEEIQAKFEKRIRALGVAPDTASTKAESLMADWDGKLAERRAKRKGLTEWAQDLSTMQSEFEARMQARSTERSRAEEVATTPWAKELVRIQRHFEDWDADLAKKRNVAVPVQSATVSWADSLQVVQEQIEAQMSPRAALRMLEAEFGDTMTDWDEDPMTAWGADLVKMQAEFEARMQSRNKKVSEEVPTTAWAQELVQIQKYFEGWDADLTRKREQRKRAEAATTPWSRELVQIQKYFEDWDANLANQREGRIAVQSGATSWADNLHVVQQQLESRMSARARAALREHDVEFDGTTSWGENLEKMQSEFEARMELRNKKHLKDEPSTPWAEELVRTQKYFEDWDASLAKKRAAREVQPDGMTAWGRSLVKAQEAFEDRMQLRNQKRGKETPFTQELVRSQKSFEDWSANLAKKRAAREARFDGMTAWGRSLQKSQKKFEARMQARNGRWVRGLVGAAQVQDEHEERMQGFADRKQARQEAREERRALVKATQDGFSDYFQARKEAQAQRRKEKNWAQGLPGAEQAKAIHETWQKEFEAQKQARLEKRRQQRE